MKITDRKEAILKIEEILKNEKIGYKVIDEDTNVKILKVEAKIHIFCMESKGNQFVINRDYFEYLDSNSLPYNLFLQDILNHKNYYIELPKAHNWVKSCFETCDKENIYLGKQVLNSIITEQKLYDKLRKLH